MDVEAPQALLRQFDQVEDPRAERSRLHLLTDIPVITLCAVLCGADTWTEVALYAGRSDTGWEPFWNRPTASPRTIPSGGSSRS